MIIPQTVLDSRGNRTGETWPTHRHKERQRRRNRRLGQTRHQANDRRFGVEAPVVPIPERLDDHGWALRRKDRIRDTPRGTAGTPER